LFLLFPMASVTLTISSMACSACAETITKAVQAVDPSATVQADVQTKQVTIDTVAAEAAIKDAIATAGYPID
jgi:copper chaperone